MMEFEWDRYNLRKFPPHAITPMEIEEVFDDYNRCSFHAYGGRKALIGITEEGRILTIIYVINNRKIRPITGWDATNTEKKSYNKRKRK